MVQTFLDFIYKHKLCSKDQSILLAVSGGVDSVLMARLFKLAGFESCGVAHCNFGLRGEESDKDEEFVKQLSKELDFEFHHKKFDTAAFAEANKLSIQLAARQLRYEWFNKLFNDHGYEKVATAHHINDSVETVIYNLTKGTGISGLTGISFSREEMIRPMAFLTREEIYQYVKKNNIEWVEDASNESDKYSRNMIRHHVIPELKKINPSLEATYLETQERLQSVERLVGSVVTQFKKNHIFIKGKDTYIEKDAIKSQELVVLDELLKTYGFNFKQVRNIYEKMEEVGKVFHSVDSILNIDREHLIISQVGKAIEDLTINSSNVTVANDFMRLRVSDSDENGNILPLNKGASFDYDRLEFPMKVRKWQEGDAFQPLGMSGKKKLSDFMIDCKIPLNLKERVCVLESDGKIVWVLGYRIDDRFKVRPDTKKVLHILLEKP